MTRIMDLMKTFGRAEKTTAQHHMVQPFHAPDMAELPAIASAPGQIAERQMPKRSHLFGAVKPHGSGASPELASVVVARRVVRNAAPVDRRISG